MAIGNPVSLTSNVASKTITATATASQTQFTVTGGYRINQISVYRGGVRLVDGQDYTAVDGSTVTLLSPASENDLLEFQIFDDFRVADAIVSDAANQTIRGNVTITGTLTGTATTATLANTATVATNAQGLTGTPNIVVGSITATSSAVGTAVTSNSTGVDVTGGVNVSGIVTASSFVGSGANLTNLNIPAGFTELDAALFN